MARESTIAGGVFDDQYTLLANPEVNDLRKTIWQTIHKEKGNLPWADVSFVLGLVQYELMHHSDEFEDPGDESPPSEWRWCQSCGARIKPDRDDGQYCEDCSK